MASRSRQGPENLASQNDPHRQRTHSWKSFLEQNDLLVDRVLRVLEFMNSQQIDLPLLLWAISWTVPELRSNPTVVYARTTLMVSIELPTILSHWHKPPRLHNSGFRTKGAHEVMTEWAIATVSTLLDSEMAPIDTIMTPNEPLSEEALLATKWRDTISDVQRCAPNTWRLFRHAAYTPAQDRRNTVKTPDACVLTMISMASFSRSHRHCRIPRLITMYLKSCGIAAKALDTLHALGITLSQRWSLNGILALSEAAHEDMVIDMKTHPWFGVHDNLNIAFKVYEQRLDNQNHFDSGTARTIIVIKDPNCTAPDFFSAQEKLVEGIKHPISFSDILSLERDAAPRLKAQNIYQVLKFLIDTPQFSFDTYNHKDSSLFDCPKNPRRLSFEYATTQYMLNTVHIEEASYEGNARILEEWFRQLNLNKLNEQMQNGDRPLIVWIGDQLTVSRIRGLKKFRYRDLNSRQWLDFLKTTFGWFHAQIAFEHSIHSQYWGTRAGHGLIHAFDLLNRKGLQSPTIQGVFHQNLKDGYLHIAAARFRDVWCVVGNVESVEGLRSCTPEQLHSMATQIVDRFASVRALQNLSDYGNDQHDDIFSQAVMWNKDILDYLALGDGIKTGDIQLIEDLLPRILYRFVGGTNSKYALEVLELMQGLYREWPDDLRNFIQQYCWLANTTGRQDSFLPIDLLQEHNVRDIKQTFMTLGPFVTWDLIHKMSASIPCQRKIKDHVEVEVNHFLRGKAHTSPDAEEDIQNLQAAYSKDAIHVYKSGRKLAARDKVKDILGLGSEGTRLQKAIERWASGRNSKVTTTEDWATYDSDSE